MNRIKGVEQRQFDTAVESETFLGTRSHHGISLTNFLPQYGQQYRAPIPMRYIPSVGEGVNGAGVGAAEDFRFRTRGGHMGSSRDSESCESTWWIYGPGDWGFKGTEQRNFTDVS